MTVINKQKFLAELGKLLTFMYEEDRQTALAMYSRMFDEAEDEQTLLSVLCSPTRQAVVIARAYNAKERKLQIYAQSREEDDAPDNGDEVPGFVQAIADIQDCVPMQSCPAAEDEDQFCLFDEEAPAEELPEAEEPAQEIAEELPFTEEEPVYEDAPAEEAPEELPEESAEEEAQEIFDEADAEEPYPDAEPVPEAEPEEKELSAEEEVDAFIADFSIDEHSEGPEAAEPQQIEDVPYEDDPEFAPPVTAPVPTIINKPRIFLLILYVIFAVPLGLAGIVLLLVPTLLFLVLSLGLLIFGFMTLFAAFGGFAVFADIMVMLGAALVVLALGLLLFWIFIWFIGGAMAGLVRGLINLGRRWCYKEVSAA